jgi:quercetin dioxygenase-like cupin family protein
MTTKLGLTISVWLVTLGLVFWLGISVGQQNAPKENKGLDAQVVSTIDLSPDMPNYQLRLRKITFEPGGVAAMHSHKERPAFAYILEGTVTELRDGGYQKEYGPGNVITESRDVTHWAENKGTTKAVLVGVDIIKP